jgi:miniconductance mechanosensitive channel
VTAKKAELEEYNARIGGDPDVRADFRSLTNVGTLRAYIRAYLRANRSIHEGMTLLVRQLQPGPEGLPIELYCFTNETDWGVYEEIQSDLFDHILAIVPEFDLRVFQNPTGADLEQLAGAGREA